MQEGVCVCVCVHGVCVSAGHMPGQATKVVIVGIVVGQTLCMLNARTERREERRSRKATGTTGNGNVYYVYSCNGNLP